MIQAASKYQPVPAARERRPAPVRESTSTQLHRAVRVRDHQRASLLRRKFPHVFVPAFSALMGWKDFATREMRSGGIIAEMLDYERRTSAARFRAVAKARKDYQHNPKSDTRLVASIPVNEFFRARQVDPKFWEDRQNLKNYKRDNPDAFIRL